MRRGMTLFVALAIVGCASDEFSGAGQVASPQAGGDLTGTWAVTWGPLVGTNTYPDSLKDSKGADSIATRTVVDSCTATGTLTLTQQSPVAYVTGPYAISRTCHSVVTKGPASNVTLTDALSGSISSGNLGSGAFTFALDNANAQYQYGLVQGGSVSGSVTWKITLPARPTKGAGTVRGDFTATKQ